MTVLLYIAQAILDRQAILLAWSFCSECFALVVQPMYIFLHSTLHQYSAKGIVFLLHRKLVAYVQPGTAVII